MKKQVEEAEAKSRRDWIDGDEEKPQRNDVAFRNPPVRFLNAEKKNRMLDVIGSMSPWYQCVRACIINL